MRGAEMLADAVALGARGHYDESWRLLDLVHQPSLNSLVSSTRGSHLRQIGAIDLARRADERALADAVDTESRADARIGLAADAEIGRAHV